MSNDNSHFPNDDRDTRPLAPDSQYRESLDSRPHILDNRIPSAIRFIHTTTDDVITIPVLHTMVVGRRNSMKDMEVSVDFSGFDAYQMGVSRFHAMIFTFDNRVTIKDLDSLNGTRLNDLDLEPSHEYTLKHGDTVTFGQLSFKIAFMY